MIYREPGFPYDLAPPHPLPRSPVRERATTCWREGIEGVGEEPSHDDSEKVCTLKKSLLFIIVISFNYCPLFHAINQFILNWEYPRVLWNKKFKKASCLGNVCQKVDTNLQRLIG